MLMKLRQRKQMQLHKNAHRFVRQIMLRIMAENLVEGEVCKRAGVERRNWSAWKHEGITPNLLSLEAVAAVLDMELVLKDRLSPAKRKGRTPGLDNPITERP